MAKKVAKGLGIFLLLIMLTVASILMFSPFLEHISMKAAINSKILCSAKFISGRDIEEAQSHSLRRPFPIDEVRFEDNKVTYTSLGISRSSVFQEDCGCVALPEGKETLDLAPMPIKANPVKLRLDRRIHKGLQTAIETNFEATSHHAAVLVIQDSAIIAEHYAPGFNAFSKFESWSMGKSLTATLIGVLIQQGRLSLDQEAPIEEWAEDDRANITIANLLNMSSGLTFSGPSDNIVQLLMKPVADHTAVYSGIPDVFSHSINKPLEFAPNTVGRYRNCDPLTLGAIVRRTVEADGETYRDWPQKNLFDKLGTDGFFLETDTKGNFILSGFDYGTANAWARLGTLYLQNGNWNGEQLIPESFVDFVKTPAQAWEEGEYGGLFWLNNTQYDFPEDAYCMKGDGGQMTCIILSVNAVVVRFAHTNIEYNWDTGVPYLFETINTHLKENQTKEGV